MDKQQPLELVSYAFSPGQIVHCKTRFKEEYEGEVIAFDLQTRILVIKCPSKQSDTTRNDIHFLVLDSVADLKILKEPPADYSTSLPTLLVEKVKQRTESAINERKRLVEAVEKKVSEDGLRLYALLSKKYEREADLNWREQSIVVMDTVLIDPPYKENNCHGLNKVSSQNAISYVQDIVRKYWDDKKQM